MPGAARGMAKKRTSTTYEFTLVLTGIEEPIPKTSGDAFSAVEDALFESGCDDATISVRCGRPFLEFAREAPSLKDAILAAIQDVLKAGVVAEIVRVDACGLVTQAEIARKIGRSRQLVHQYVTGVRGPDGFPPPVSDLDDGMRWDWAEVAGWLWKNGLIEESVVQEAVAVAAINSALEWDRQRRGHPGLTAEVARSLGGTPANRRKGEAMIGEATRATTCSLGEREVGIEEALQLRDQAQEDGTLPLDFRCRECGKRVRPHRAGSGSSAHFEHYRRNPQCTLSDPLRR